MKVQIERFSFEWSHHRISSTDSKVKATLQNSIIHSGSERVKQESQCSVQCPNTEEFKVFESRIEDCVMFDVASKMINNLNLHFANC